MMAIPKNADPVLLTTSILLMSGDLFAFVPEVNKHKSLLRTLSRVLGLISPTHILIAVSIGLSCQPG